MVRSDSLLAAIEAFCARHGMSATAFGLKAAKDGHLVRRLKDAKSMTLKRIDRVEKFMADYENANASPSSDPSELQPKPTRGVARPQQKERAA